MPFKLGSKSECLKININYIYKKSINVKISFKNFLICMITFLRSKFALSIFKQKLESDFKI